MIPAERTGGMNPAEQNCGIIMSNAEQQKVGIHNRPRREKWRQPHTATKWRNETRRAKLRHDDEPRIAKT